MRRQEKEEKGCVPTKPEKTKGQNEMNLLNITHICITALLCIVLAVLGKRSDRRFYAGIPAAVIGFAASFLYARFYANGEGTALLTGVLAGGLGLAALSFFIFLHIFGEGAADAAHKATPSAVPLPDSEEVIETAAETENEEDSVAPETVAAVDKQPETREADPAGAAEAEQAETNAAELPTTTTIDTGTIDADTTEAEVAGTLGTEPAEESKPVSAAQQRLIEQAQGYEQAGQTRLASRIYQSILDQTEDDSLRALAAEGLKRCRKS